MGEPRSPRPRSRSPPTAAVGLATGSKVSAAAKHCCITPITWCACLDREHLGLGGQPDVAGGDHVDACGGGERGQKRGWASAELAEGAAPTACNSDDQTLWVSNPRSSASRRAHTLRTPRPRHRSPAPTQWPSTAAMTGTGQASKALMASCSTNTKDLRGSGAAGERGSGIWPGGACPRRRQQQRPAAAGRRLPHLPAHLPACCAAGRCCLHAAGDGCHLPHQHAHCAVGSCCATHALT